MQSWTSMTVVTTFHVGALLVTAYLLDNNMLSCVVRTMIFFAAFLFAALGFLITLKHQEQLYVRLKWIDMAESRLGTDSLKPSVFVRAGNGRKGQIRYFFLRTFWTVGSLMSLFYAVLMIIDVLCIFAIPDMLGT
jgi:hypothetical protein